MKVVEKDPKGSSSSGSKNTGHKAKNAAQTADQLSTEPHKTPKGVRQEIIKKFPVRCNLEDYETTYNTFSWEDAKREISYFAGGKVNASYNAVDCHLVNDKKNGC